MSYSGCLRPPCCAVSHRSVTSSTKLAAGSSSMLAYLDQMHCLLRELDAAIAQRLPRCVAESRYASFCSQPTKDLHRTRLLRTPTMEGSSLGTGRLAVAQERSKEVGLVGQAQGRLSFPGLTDTEPEATMVAPGRMSRCPDLIRPSSVSVPWSWPDCARSLSPDRQGPRDLRQLPARLDGPSRRRRGPSRRCVEP